MNVSNDKEKEIKIMLQRKMKLYLLSGIFFFIFLACALYYYFLFTNGTFFPLAALGPQTPEFQAQMELVTNLLVVAFMISIIFFVSALLIKRK